MLDLAYYSLVNAIPKEWKAKIKQNILRGSDPKVKHSDITHLKINLEKLKNKNIYESLSYNKTTPTAENKWVEYYPFLDKLNWSDVYMIPYKASKDTKLHSLQYSILHRFAGCNYNLSNWKVVDRPGCPNCTDIDTIEHFYYYCSEAKIVWTAVKKISKAVLNMDYNFTFLESLLGIPFEKNVPCQILNLLILVGKQCIYLSRRKEHHVSEKYFYNMIHQALESEIYLAKVATKVNNDLIDICHQILSYCI